jgi:outer membrane protein, multidrug efflux system
VSPRGPSPSPWKTARWVMPWLLLPGCAVGPNFVAPNGEAPPAWQGLATSRPSQPSVPTASPVQLVEWWKSFHDPTLTSLVERAINANLDLRQAQARIRQARAARGVAGAGLWPTVDVSASYRRSFSGGSSGISGASVSGGPIFIPSGDGQGARDLFQTGLDAAWELDIFGGVRRQIEAADADLQAAVDDGRDLWVSLAAEVGTNYIDLRGLQQQIATARDNLEAQRHTAEISRQRYEAGFVSALDVANAKAQEATTRSQIPVVESAAQAAIYNLSLLLGREPAALARELSLQAPIPVTPPEVPVGLPSDLLRRRPDIRRAERQLHAATARIGVATADLFPRFSLSGSFGLSGNTAGSLTDWANRFWGFGPTVSWPVFDAGRIRANIEVQNALQEETLNAYQQTVLTALKDVETALVAYAKEQEHRQSLSEAVAYNRKAVDLARTLYVAGRRDFLSVLDAQRSLYLSEDALVRSTQGVASGLIALYKALGGGWEMGF